MHNRHLWWVGVVLGLSAGAAAQEARGPWELTLGASAVTGAGPTGIYAAGDAGLGYFVTPSLELSLRQSLQYTDIDVSSALIGFSRFAVDWHFPLDRDERLLPFVGVHGGYLWGEAARSSAEVGPEAGFKWFTAHDTFIYLSVEYRILLTAEPISTSVLGHGDFIYTLGLGFRF